MLAQEQLLECHDDAYEVAPHVRRWLDPESPCSVTTYLSLTLDYWQRWAELDQVAAGGAIDLSSAADDAAAWARRVRGQYEYAPDR